MKRKEKNILTTYQKKSAIFLCVKKNIYFLIAMSSFYRERKKKDI
jgi:hypothetical protein